MFQEARIRLTLWYLFIIGLVSLFFSLVIYRVQSAELNRFAEAQKLRIERQYRPDFILPPKPRQIDPDLIASASKRLLQNLIFLNGLIIIISGGLGYFLAGKTLQPIKEMVDEQDRFISDSSHEMRTPLTSLKTALEVGLRDKKMTLYEAKNLLQENLEDVNRLQKLTDSLIQLNKKTLKSDLVFKKINLKTVAQNALQQLKNQALEKKIIINTSLKNAYFWGDPDKITSLVTILLDNAIKYSPQNSKISLKTEGDNHLVKVSVKDRGWGIDERDLPHVFDRFYRADSSRTTLQKSSGYGLGLSIAKMIADQHHAKISLKSKVGKGTTFSVSFPRSLA